jgi:glyoxylase-like metal-dependent hydrolase (beta-lactamase superfamily II)
MIKPTITRHPDGIFAIDCEYVRPGLAAAHLVVEAGRAAFVDVGTSLSVPYLLAALDELGIAREALDYLFLTHVHLDHAGGAGALMRELPNAKAVLHPRGAPHLIDPEKLIAGSLVVYGDRFASLYGEIVPLPADRVIVTKDMQRIALAGRPFEFIHTPGHALHHHCIVDLEHACIFSGDTFGVSYRELDSEQGAFVIPATTPTQFDPEQLVASIDRQLSYRPESIYLMHYSRVTGVDRLGESLKAGVRELAEIGRRYGTAADPLAAMTRAMLDSWVRRARAHGARVSDAEAEELLRMDATLNAQGLAVWLERQKRAV